jgi:SNF2 family DNA or RNA helicase
MGYTKSLEGGRGSLAPYIKDDIQFYPHQIEGIRTLARWKSFILADDMGLGKTLQSLVVFGMDVYRSWAKTA